MTISEEDRAQLGEELRKADAVVLTYACNQPEHLEELSAFWIPELRRLEVSYSSIIIIFFIYIRLFEFCSPGHLCYIF